MSCTQVESTFIFRGSESLPLNINCTSEAHADDEGVSFGGTEAALRWSYCSGNSFWLGGLQAWEVAAYRAEAPPREAGCTERICEKSTLQVCPTSPVLHHLHERLKYLNTTYFVF